MIISYGAFLFVTIFMLIAAYSDFRWMIIPNWISVVLIAGFFLFAFVKGFIFTQYFSHLTIAFGVFFLGFIFFILGAMGGGDVKLLTAASIWLDPSSILIFVFLVTLIGALLGIGKAIHIIMINYRSGKGFDISALRRSQIAYGIAISIGMIITFPLTVWMTHPS